MYITLYTLKGPEIRGRLKTLPPPGAPLRLKLCEDVPPYLRNILSYFQLKTKGQRNFNVMRFRRPAWGPAGRGLTPTGRGPPSRTPPKTCQKPLQNSLQLSQHSLEPPGATQESYNQPKTLLKPPQDLSRTDRPGALPAVAPHVLALRTYTQLT